MLSYIKYYNKLNYLITFKYYLLFFCYVLIDLHKSNIFINEIHNYISSIYSDLYRIIPIQIYPLSHPHLLNFNLHLNPFLNLSNSLQLTDIFLNTISTNAHIIKNQAYQLMIINLIHLLSCVSLFCIFNMLNL
jgi:hypothetical protein